LAARNKLSHDYKTREKIQTTQIVKRLHAHVLSETGDIMTVSQVNAARVLLNKTIPDLKAIEVQGELDHKVTADGFIFKTTSN